MCTYHLKILDEHYLTKWKQLFRGTCVLFGSLLWKKVFVLLNCLPIYVFIDISHMKILPAWYSKLSSCLENDGRFFLQIMFQFIGDRSHLIYRMRKGLNGINFVLVFYKVNNVPFLYHKIFKILLSIHNLVDICEASLMFVKSNVYFTPIYSIIEDLQCLFH